MRNDRSPLVRVQPPAAFVAVLLAATLASWSATPATAQEAPAPPEPPVELRVERDDGRVTVAGDYTVEAGQVVEDLVVAGGDLRVRGEVDGDVVVVGGDLILDESGIIRGDALVTGGEFIDEGGAYFGEVREVDDLAGIGAAGSFDVGGDREVIRERQREVHSESRRIRHDEGWFGSIKSGLAGLVSTVAFGLLLAGLGAALIFYGRPYLDTVSDTIRSSVLRSGGVGLAAGFLVIPAFVALVVVLLVSIIGIPLLLLAVPLYPVAIAAALGLGLLAAAHALGERTAEQRRPFDFGARNAYSYLFTGLAMFLMPLAGAYLLEMTGFLGWLGAMLKGVAIAVLWVATTIGLGAVVLSRAGTRRTFVTPLAGDVPTPGTDPLLDDEPFTSEPRV